MYAGPCGLWQVRTFLILALVKVPSAWQMASTLFTATQPRDFWCAPPQHLSHIGVDIWKNLSHLKETNHRTGRQTLNPCYIYSLNYTDSLLKAPIAPVLRDVPLQRCHKFNYDSAPTITTKWDLVCGRQILISISQFFYLVGILFGAVLSRLEIKRYGPRKVVLVAMIFQIIFGVMAAFSPILEMKLIMRFLIACSCSNMLSASYVICKDIVHSTAKTVISGCFENFWSLGIISLPVWSYFLPNWVELQLALSIPTFFILILFKWIPGSPIWLLMKGKYSEAKTLLEMAAKLNHRNVPDLDFEKCIDTSQAVKPGAWLQFIQTYNSLELAMLHMCWALTFVTYYGLLVNLNSLGDNLGLITILAGVAEIFGVFLGLGLILKTRRKWLVLGIILIGAGLLMGLCWFVPRTPNSKYTTEEIMVGLAMTARIAASASYTLLMVSSTEVFEPHFRPIANQSCTLFAKTLVLVAPFVEATELYGGKATLSGYGTLLILIGICTLVFARKVEHCD